MLTSTESIHLAISLSCLSGHVCFLAGSPVNSERVPSAKSDISKSQDSPAISLFHTNRKHAQWALVGAWRRYKKGRRMLATRPKVHTFTHGAKSQTTCVRGLQLPHKSSLNCDVSCQSTSMLVNITTRNITFAALANSEHPRPSTQN